MTHPILTIVHFVCRSLRGSTVPTQNGIGLGQSHYHIQSEDTLSQFGVSRFYSTKAIVFAAFAAMFSLITALVILSGYLVTCNELHYETRRQVLGKTTLGKVFVFYLWVENGWSWEDFDWNSLACKRSLQAL